MKIDADEAWIVVDALENYLDHHRAMAELPGRLKPDINQDKIELIENTLKRFLRSSRALDRIEGFK